MKPNLKKNNILVITESFNVGGVETQILTQLSETSKDNNYFLISSGGALVKKAELLGAKHFNMDFSDQEKDSILKNSEEIIKIIKENKIDLVHVHPFNTFYPSIIACLKTKTKYVVTMHGVPVFSWSFSIYGEESSYFWKNVVFGHAEAVYAITDEVAAMLKDKYGVPRDKILILPNYINEKFRETRKVVSVNKFACVGRIDGDREDLVKAAISLVARCSTNNPATRLDVIGSGSSLEKIKIFAEVVNTELGKDIVNVVGQNNSFAEKINDYDVIIGMGRSAMEGIASKRAVLVISYEGKPKGIISGKNFEEFAFSNFTGRGMKDIDQESVLNTLSDARAINDSIKNSFEKFKRLYSKEEIVSNLNKSYIKSIKSSPSRDYENALELANLLLDLKNVISFERKSAKDAINQLRFEKENIERELLEIKECKTWRVGLMTGTLIKKPHQIPKVVKKLIIKILKKVLPQKVKNHVKKQMFAHPYLFHPMRLLKRAKHISTLKTIISNCSYKGIIIYPPTIDWDMPLFQRPQQLALAFAKEGYLFFYGTANLNNDNVEGFKKIAENLYVTNQIEILKDVEDKIVFISWPLNKPFAEKFKKSKLIYDFIDELEVFDARGKTQSEMYKNHEYLVKKADVVVCTADKLLDSANKLKPKKSVLSPNGVDIEHFHKISKEAPDDIKEIVKSKKPIIGYYGAIAEWFDYDLLERMATERPDYEFIMIGPLNYDNALNKNKHLFEIKNIHFLGAKKYEELPTYLSYFTIATIPFLVNKITESTSPVKLFEYMAGGKPIVTSNMYECTKYKSVLVAESHDGFIENIDKAIKLKDDRHYLDQLQKDAEDNTWSRRAKDIIGAL